MSATTETWPRDALPLGTVLNGYTIDGMLGRGGFGITYRALDRLDQIFAIKECFPRQFAVRQDGEVLPTDAADAESLNDCMGRFLREAKALMHLSRIGAAGDGVVRVATFFEANGTAYIVMEFLGGQSLEAYLKANPGGIPEARLNDLLHRLLHAIGCVHDAGLLHRDIKPANIYLREDGRPVLIDFGATRGTGGGQTMTFTQIYSESFAPLEQIAGSQQGPFSDLYALGVTFYLAIGGKAIDAFTRHQAILRGKRDPLIPAVELGAGRYDPRLLATIDAALKVAPEERPQSVRDLLQLLTGPAEDDDATRIAVASKPQPVWEPATIIQEAPPTLVAEAAPTMIAAPLPPRPPAAASGNRLWIAIVILVPVLAIACGGAGLWYYLDRQKTLDSTAAQEKAAADAAAQQKTAADAAARKAAEDARRQADQQAAARAAQKAADDAQAQARLDAAQKATSQQAADAKAAADAQAAADKAAADRAAQSKAAAEKAAADRAAAAGRSAEVKAAETMVSARMDRPAEELDRAAKLDVREHYDSALALFHQGNFSGAEIAFKFFQRQYPASPLAGHAQYFVGQSFMMRGNYIGAADAFDEGLRRYPDGNQRGETLAKLGLAQGEIGRTAEACAAFSRLENNFREMSADVRQMLNAGKQRFGCGG
jgi:tol-pal system protein YbgF